MDSQAIKKEAWEITKKNFGTLWKALVINVILSLIYTIGLNYVLKGVDKNILTIVDLVYNLLTIPFSFGLTKYLLDVADNKKPKMPDLFYYYRHNVLEVIVLAMILSILYSVGISLLIVPAIYFFLIFSMSQNILILNKRNPLDAMSDSYILTRGYRLNYLMFIISYLPWFALSVITLGVGFIWFMPYFLVGQKIYYYKLVEIKDSPKKTTKSSKEKIPEAKITKPKKTTKKKEAK